MVALIPEAVAAAYVVERVADNARERRSHHATVHWWFWYTTRKQVYIIWMSAIILTGLYFNCYWLVTLPVSATSLLITNNVMLGMKGLKLSAIRKQLLAILLVQVLPCLYLYIFCSIRLARTSLISCARSSKSRARFIPQNTLKSLYPKNIIHVLCMWNVFVWDTREYGQVMIFLPLHAWRTYRIKLPLWRLRRRYHMY